LWAALGYGRRLWQWPAVSAAVALVFALIYMPRPAWFPDWWAAPLTFDYPSELNPWFAPFYFSVVTLTTLGLGDFTPANVPAQILVMSEVIIGYVMLGVLLALISLYFRR